MTTNRTMLTNQYIDFLDAAFNEVSKSKEWNSSINNYSYILQNTTIRMDAGRQTGKTTAANWFISGLDTLKYDVIHISPVDPSYRATVFPTVTWIKGDSKDLANPCFLTDHIRKHEVSSKLSLNRQKIFIIEECLDYNHGLFVENLVDLRFKFPPIVIVIGMQ